MPKILIATGGTGGHVYPAMALAQQILQEIPDSQVLFVGGGLKENRYFDHQAFPFRTVSCGAFLSKRPSALMGAFANIAKGVWQSCAIIREFHPDVAVGFGSFYAFPPLVAAKIMSVPLVLHEANSIPGKVNRLLSRWATVTGVHFPETAHLLKGHSVEVGLPLRQGFCHATINSADAKTHFGLHPEKLTLLVFGGSQGARSINILVSEALKELKATQAFQVLHLVGDPSMVDQIQDGYLQGGIRACVKPFESRMDIAWNAADVVISRAGAGTIAEQLEFEVPGILIPYPRATDNHQEHNADFMVATVGGAVKLHEKGLLPSRLATCLAEFLKDGTLLAAMRHAMKEYKKRARARQDVWDKLVGIGEKL